MVLDKELGNAIEYIPGKLYWVSLPQRPSIALSAKYHFFSIDQELVYWNFFLDFGPLNLGQLYRFCEKLNSFLDDPALQDRPICFYSGVRENFRANAVCLLSGWGIMCQDKTPEEAFRPFRHLSFTPYHDATPGRCTYHLTILDCLKGLAKAKLHGFVDFNDFDVREYEHYEQVENGDLNWIVKGKFVAFAGPQNRKTVIGDGYSTMVPEDYTDYFKSKNVQLVVRLNQKYYDESKFTKEGIDHLDLYYMDGTTPPEHILRRFLAKCESTEGAIAVHCKAGLGRTGTCIGCYMIKHYRFSAAECIGWMRICRPGSVIGPQQQYLRDNEQRLWHEGEIMRRRLAPLPLSPVKAPHLEEFYSSSSEEKQELPALITTHQVDRLAYTMDSLAMADGGAVTTTSTTTHISLFRKSALEQAHAEASASATVTTSSTTTARTKSRFSGVSVRTQGDILRQRRARVKSTDSTDSAHSAGSSGRGRIAELLGWK